MKSLLEYSAYQGGSWKSRSPAHSDECGTSIWPGGGLNSEYQPLKSVILCKPDSSFPKVSNPERVQFMESVDWRVMRHEFNAIEKVFTKLGVKVEILENNAFANPSPNLIFVRDLFFSTPWGAVLGRMASPIRAGEEKWAQEALARCGVPILHLIRGTGTFEGADALWLRPDTVLLGIGNRTNEAGYRQLKAVMKEFSVNVIPIRLPRQVQHLLGGLQIVGKNTALLRTEIFSPRVAVFLEKEGLHCIEVSESPEITRSQAMNIVTLREKTVLMPRRCPGFRRLLENHGIKIAAEVEIDQISRAAGGLACASGILSRKIKARNRSR